MVKPEYPRPETPSLTDEQRADVVALARWEVGRILRDLVEVHLPFVIEQTAVYTYDLGLDNQTPKSVEGVPVSEPPSTLLAEVQGIHLLLRQHLLPGQM